MNYPQAGMKDPRATDCCNEASAKSSFTSQLHENLWRRKRRLENDLAEVDEALKTLTEDANVQKVVRLLEVAQK